MLGLLDRVTRRYLDWRKKKAADAFLRDNPDMALGLKELSVDANGKFEGTFVTAGAALIANEMAKMLVDANAGNYFEFEFLPQWERDIRPVRVLVQWRDGQSPTQRNAALTRTMEQAILMIDALKDRLAPYDEWSKADEENLVHIVKEYERRYLDPPEWRQS